MQSKGLNAIHIAALVGAGLIAGVVISQEPSQEASAALLLTATISAIVLSWTYQAGRFDSEKKEHSLALNSQFFTWVRDLDFGPLWDTSDHTGNPYCPVLVTRAVLAPNPDEPTQLANEVPVHSIPTFKQAKTHMEAYPALSSAWTECEKAIASFNAVRSKVLPDLRSTVERLMAASYPGLRQVTGFEDYQRPQYDRIRAEYLVFDRLRAAAGVPNLATGDPYPDGAPNPKILNWQGTAIIVSPDPADIDAARLVRVLGPAWGQVGLRHEVAELVSLRRAADMALEPLVRAFAEVNERLSTGHRILGSCENGL